MFYYLKGERAYRENGLCVIDCGGVGYRLTVSMNTSEAMTTKLGKEVKLFTHLAVREKISLPQGCFFFIKRRSPTENLMICISLLYPHKKIIYRLLLLRSKVWSSGSCSNNPAP